MAELKRILLVEDDADIQEIAIMALEDLADFTVIGCLSGEAALEAAPGAAADLILLDVMMPGLDGPATLAALRQIPQTASTPVIFMTGRADPEDVARFHELGAVGVIAKPFDPMSLAEQIATLWQAQD